MSEVTSQLTITVETSVARVRESGMALKSHGGTIQGAGVDSAESDEDNLRRR